MAYDRFAQYYDAIYRAQGKNYELEACRIHRLVRQYKLSSGNQLLDVGCGTGEHLRFLKAFYHVEGLDASAEMLAAAKQKLPDVPLHQGDMRTFDLGPKFDVVMCLFGSIGYVETLDGLYQAVGNMRRHLTAGGVLLIEPWFAPGEAKDGHTHVAVANEPKMKVVRVGLTKVEGRVSEIRFHFVVAEETGIKHFEERHRLGLFKPEEYKAAMEQAGLTVHFEQKGLSGRGIYIACANALSLGCGSTRTSITRAPDTRPRSAARQASIRQQPGSP